MFIVDTQVHIWKEETPDRPWIPGARERMRLNGHREARVEIVKNAPHSMYWETPQLFNDAVASFLKDIATA